MTLSATSDHMPDLTRRRNWRSTKSRLMEALMVLAFVLVLVPLVFVIGTLSLAGVPFFAGFSSKEEILGAVWAGGLPGPFAILMLVAFLTAFYMFRVVFLAFLGEPGPAPAPAPVPAPVSGGRSRCGSPKKARTWSSLTSTPRRCKRRPSCSVRKARDAWR